MCFFSLYIVDYNLQSVFASGNFPNEMEDNHDCTDFDKWSKRRCYKIMDLSVRFQLFQNYSWKKMRYNYFFNSFNVIIPQQHGFFRERSLETQFYCRSLTTLLQGHAYSGGYRWH